VGGHEPLDTDDLNSDPERRSLIDTDTSVTEARQIKVLDTMLRGGFSALDTEQRQLFKEMRAQTVGTGSEGGFTVPTEFRNRVAEAMKAFGGLANIATVFETDSGNPITWAITDGTADEGVMIGEKEESTEQDMEFGQVVIGAKKMTSNIVKISDELLQDSGVDIAGLIARRIGSRLGRCRPAGPQARGGSGLPCRHCPLAVQRQHPARPQADERWTGAPALAA